MSTNIIQATTFFEGIALPLLPRIGAAKLIPLYPKTKEPQTKLVPRPLEMKSNDPAQIQAWAAAEPNANVGVYADRVLGGLWFLDKDGATSLVQKYGSETGRKFPDTLLVRSSVVTIDGKKVTKGHWYFRHTAKTLAILKNITEDETGGLFGMRLHNEYVCSIGSIHPDTGLPYEIAKDAVIIEAPDEFVDWLLSHVKYNCTGDFTKKPDGWINEPIVHGGINNQLTKIAGYYIQAKNINDADALADILIGHAERQAVCKDGVTPYSCNLDEIRQIAHGAVSRWKTGEEKAAEKAVIFPAAVAPAAAPSGNLGVDIIPFHVVGVDREPIGDFKDCLCVFGTQADSDAANDLGFNAATVLDGIGEVQFRASVRIIKAKYERVVIFKKTEGTLKLEEMINPGAAFVEDVDPQDCLTNPAEQIADILKTELVRKTSILRTADEMRLEIATILNLGLANVLIQDPRVVVASLMDDLRGLQFTDGRFPKPLTSKSLWGLMGEFVELAYPTTVACREMILYEMLPMLGVLLGATYYLPYGSDRHFPSLFSLAIGRTTDGKGQAMHHCQKAIELIDPVWFKDNMHSNPASGEGLVRMLAGRNVLAGGQKNRVAIVNSEMSTCFNAQARKDSTLSGQLRTAYDGDRVENFRSEGKKSFAAEKYILGFVGTITPPELRGVMPLIDWTNGSANRFLWSIGFKDKELGRSSKCPDFTDWTNRARKLVEMNLREANPVAIDYSPAGAESWDDWYHSLPAHQDDVLSESQARVAANCARVANLYAQIDERRLDGWPIQLEPRHVEAGIEIVGRSRESVEWYLNDSKITSASNSKVGYEDVQKVKAAMTAKIRETGIAELTGSEAHRLFSNKTATQRDEICIQAGFKIRTRKPEHGGKPTIIWTE